MMKNKIIRNTKEYRLMVYIISKYFAVQILKMKINGNLLFQT